MSEETEERVESLDFDVQGAGTLRCSVSGGHQCGTATGFSIAASWNVHGINYGGVMDKSEAKRLAEHILKAIAELPEEPL